MTYIEREAPDQKTFMRVMSRAMRAWKAGEPVHREMTWIRFMSGALACKGRIPQVDWFSQCFDEDHPAFEGFEQVWGMLAGGPGSVLPRFLDTSEQGTWLNACLHFTAIKALSVAASPSWFSLSEALALRLLTTEIKGVHADDVRLPFGAFYVELPPGLLWWDHVDTGRHEVRALSIVEGDAPRVSGKADTEKNPGRRLLVMCYCEPNANSVDPADDNLAYFTIPLYSKELTLTEMFDSDRAVVEVNSTERMLRDDNKVNGKFGGMELTNMQLRNLVRQFVVNVLLYLNTPNADVVHASADKVRRLKKMKAKGKKARQRQKDQIAKVRAERNWLVGSRVTIDRDLKKAVAEGKKGTGGKLRFKSLVRGHWRNQAHGPGRTLRKMIWIEPHVRGGELDGPLLGHSYDVKGKKTR